MRELNTLEVVNVSGGYGEELLVASLLFGGLVTAGLIAASTSYPYYGYGYGYDVIYDPYYPSIYYDPYPYYYEDVYYIY